MVCRSYPAAEKPDSISIPPVRLALWVPCSAPPASSKIESGVEAFSAAASASVVRSPCSPAVAKTGTVMSPMRTRQEMLSVPSASVAVMVHSPLSVRARTVPFLSTVAMFLSLVVQ